MSFNVAKSLRLVTAAVAVSYVLLFLFVSLSRIDYEFELEYLESGSILQAERIVAGEKLYVNPSIDFVPFIYTPAYFYVSALGSRLIGPGYFPLRLISFISAILCFILIFQFVRKETRSSFAGLISASLYAATYNLTGTYFDIARVDSMFMMWLLGALYLLRHYRNSASYFGAGLLLFMAFMTKQSALTVAVPMAIYCLVSSRKRFAVFAGTLVVTLAVSTYWMDSIHGGWYSHYVFSLPGQHQFWMLPFLRYWPLSIFLPMSVAVIAGIVYVHRLIARSERESARYYLFMSAGMLLASWISISHLGSDSNSLMPAYACIAILFGLGVREVLQTAAPPFKGHHSAITKYIYLACLLQFFSLVYNPFDRLPGDSDVLAGRRLVSMLSDIPGDIYIPNHPYLAVKAGKPAFAHSMALRDILKGRDGSIKTQFTAEILGAFEKRRFSAVVLDRKQWWFDEKVRECYCLLDSSALDESEFWPVAGSRTRPERIFRLCED